jgi:hypothetical protein
VAENNYPWQKIIIRGKKKKNLYKGACALSADPETPLPRTMSQATTPRETPSPCYQLSAPKLVNRLSVRSSFSMSVLLLTSVNAAGGLPRVFVPALPRPHLQKLHVRRNLPPCFHERVFGFPDWEPTLHAKRGGRAAHREPGGEYMRFFLFSKKIHVSDLT